VFCGAGTTKRGIGVPGLETGSLGGKCLEEVVNWESTETGEKIHYFLPKEGLNNSNMKCLPEKKGMFQHVVKTHL